MCWFPVVAPNLACSVRDPLFSPCTTSHHHPARARPHRTGGPGPRPGRALPA
jgi:hypothetical protein